MREDAGQRACGAGNGVSFWKRTGRNQRMNFGRNHRMTSNCIAEIQPPEPWELDEFNRYETIRLEHGLLIGGSTDESRIDSIKRYQRLAFVSGYRVGHAFGEMSPHCPECGEDIYCPDCRPCANCPYQQHD